MERLTRTLLAALIVHAAACSSGRTASPPRAPVARRPPRSTAAPPAPAVARAPWAADAPQADPEARRVFLLRASQPGGMLAQPAAPPRVTALALANTARGEAQGMRREEATVSATLQEGERATVQVRIAAGECATFIAQGGLGVVEVDLFLTAAGGEILAEDPTTGPFAVIGGRGVCFPNRGTGTLSAELHVQARRGSGVVLVEGYRRAGTP